MGSSIASSDIDVDEVPESYRTEFNTFLECVEEYSDASDRSTLLRDLMSSVDSLLSTYSEQHETRPQPLETLDDLLWQWFQDPPTPETFEQEMDELVDDVHEVLISGGVSVTNNESSSEETSDSDSSDGGDDDQALSTNDEESVNGDTLSIELDVDFTMLEDFLMEAEDELQTLENLMIEVEENPDPDQLNRLYRAMHTLKGGFGFCNLENCSDITHAAEDLLDNLREDPPEQINQHWMELLLSSIDFVRSILTKLQSAVEQETQTLSTDLTNEYVDCLKTDLRRAADGKKRSDDFDTLGMDNGSDSGEEQSLESDQVKVDLDTIDEVVDLIGELVISQSELDEQLNGQRDRETNQVLSKQQKIMNKLQRKSMDMRMLPIKREFRKFPRIVRDLSAELDKEIDLTIEGETTEIDKSILDSLEGPLMHLVRNAIDHGLESPEEREKNGKPREGQIHLRAYHESGEVYVEVEDDGKGLPTDVIESKAIEKGLIDEDHGLSSDEIHDQILEPGFSTAEEVTDVSGRGVGLDVVATEIESLQGNLLIDSTEGQGTTFTMELPLTVAIIDGLVTRIGSETFIIPANQIEESVNPSPEDLKTVQGRGRVLRFRDSVVPVVDPGELLNDLTGHDQLDDRSILVVVHTSEGQFAVWVDELKAHQQIVIKQMEGHELSDVNLTSGGAIMGDGSVGLILDLNGLARHCLDQASFESTQTNLTEDNNVKEPA